MENLPERLAERSLELLRRHILVALAERNIHRLYEAQLGLDLVGGVVSDTVDQSPEDRGERTRPGRTVSQQSARYYVRPSLLRGEARGRAGLGGASPIWLNVVTH